MTRNNVLKVPYCRKGEFYVSLIAKQVEVLYKYCEKIRMLIHWRTECIPYSKNCAFKWAALNNVKLWCHSYSVSACLQKKPVRADVKTQACEIWPIRADWEYEKNNAWSEHQNMLTFSDRMDLKMGIIQDIWDHRLTSITNTKHSPWSVC